MIRGRRRLVLTLAVAMSFAYAANAQAAGYVVDTTSANAGTLACTGAAADCSLPGAVTNSNATPGPNAITFDPTVFTGGQTISLTSTLGINNQSLTITGPGNLTLDQTGTNLRVITIGGGITGGVSISGLVVTGGDPITPTGTVKGGGISTDSDLTLSNVTVSGNKTTAASAAAASVSANAGGIFNAGGSTLTVDHSVVSGNQVIATKTAGASTAFALGAGIQSDGPVQIHYSQISGNTATAVNSDLVGAGGAEADGGGVRVGTALEIDHSTISGNTLDAQTSSATGNATTQAGGVLVHGGPDATLSLELSTVSGNRSKVVATPVTGSLTELGGGVQTNGAGNDTLTSSTIADNGPLPSSNSSSMTDANVRTDSAGTTTFANTIVANPVGPTSTQCEGTMTSAGFNDEFPASPPTCGFATPTDLTVDPMLGPLQNNGGPVQTMALLPGSLAIDAGSNAAQTPAFLAQDQRGSLRPVDFAGLANGTGNGTDIGAFEAQKACATQSTPASTCPVSNPPATGPTGKRAAALKKCKKQHSKKKRKKCRKRARKLPV
jgi:hypothetical protein